MEFDVSHPIEPFRGCRHDPGEVARLARLHRLSLLDDAGVSAARDFAAKLVGDGVAPASVFIAVQRRAGAAVFGFHEKGTLTGVLAAFPVDAEGLQRLREGSFNAIDLDLDLVARPGETPAAYYGWGFAASTPNGGRAVVKASAQIHRELYWATPTFARAVTADGVRALTAIGFRPVDGGGANLLWIAPNSSRIGR